MSEARTPTIKFGTFGGVFVPNVLTILGVIMFMRTGWVVGQTGFYGALIILTIANCITLLTSLALSAIATNTKIGSGGAYFMVSRSLGLEIGGSIGVPLFLAQAVSVAFYVIGFTESLTYFFPDLNIRIVAAGVTAAIFLVTWVGSDIAVKAQYLIFGILILSLISFFAGWRPISHFSNNQFSAYTESFEFWKVFAIFFPAVTGVMAGASMSGDLKNPARSIPLGTLAAVVITFLIYGLQMFYLSRHADRSELVSNPLIMKDLSVFPPMIFAGLWAATLSSALASLLAAPRTLQALAADGVMPQFLARKSGAKSEPRIALAVSFGLALLCVLIGELNLIAPIISMFFLATYGMVNLVAGLEGLVANPSYRPTFRVHWIFCLIGAAGCLGVMFLLNTVATLVSVVLMGSLYLYLAQKRYHTAWGDMRSGFWFSLTRFSLLKFADSSQHLRNWRPVILVLTGNPATRLRLVQFAHWLESKCGFLFLCQILVGPWEKFSPRIEGAKASIDQFIKDNGFSAVSEVMTASDFREGVTHLIQTVGLGPISPNTVLIGWSEDVLKQDMFRDTIQRILDLKKNMLLLIQRNEESKDQLQPYIDVWWRSKRNGILMGTLAHLLRTNSRWKKHQLRIFMVIPHESGIVEAKANLEQQLKDSRIQAKSCVISSQKPIRETMTEYSEFSEVCFMGVNLENLKTQEAAFRNVQSTATSLKGDVFIARIWQELES